MTTEGHDPDWVPDACTLPTVEQPLRRAAWHDLLAREVLAVERLGPTHLRLPLRADPEVAARAAGLATLETQCCSFFEFDLVLRDGAVSLDVHTPPAHADVLVAIADRATSTGEDGP